MKSNLIGVIHLPPLIGTPSENPLSPSEIMDHAVKIAVKEARLLEDAGFDAIMIENFGDAPFYKDQVPAETIAAMTVILTEVRKNTKISLGVNILRNDAFSALAVAVATGAQMIRVNVLSGLVATDQGLIEGKAAALLRERARLNASKIKILADIHVKHAVTLSSKDPLIAIEENVGRGGADGIIVTGATTGRSPDLKYVREAAKIAEAHEVPLYIGSGLTVEGLKTLKPKGISAIVGSALRKDGKAGSPLEPARVKAITQAWNQYKKG